MDGGYCNCCNGNYNVDDYYSNEVQMDVTMKDDYFSLMVLTLMASRVMRMTVQTNHQHVQQIQLPMQD